MNKTLINDNWKCKLLTYDEKALDIGYGMEPDGYFDVELPHDALIHDSSLFYRDFVIWYKKDLYIEKEISGRGHLFLYFEGVYMDASVYINGEKCCRWVNGYTSFYFDAASYLNEGANEIYVSIDYRCPNARWYAGPGINRNVWLISSENPDCLRIDGLYVFAKKESNKWIVSSFAEPHNSISGDSKVVFTIDDDHVFDGLPDENGVYKGSTEYDAPDLWEIDSPTVYRLRADLYVDGQLKDSNLSSFGFREAVFDPDKGFFLNGRHIKLEGVCIHSDYGAYGSAYNEDIARKQLLALKDMGVNAARLAHNVYAPGVLDLCDELGVLVLDEAFDCWKNGKNPFDYGRFFDEWYEKDIESWIRRDRNHPCIIMHSAGNEIYDTHKDEHGRETLERIAAKINEYDFGGNACVTLCSNYMAWENTQKAVSALKVSGYNYTERLYDEHHKKYPNRCIFGSETGSLTQSRGIYHFPYDASLLSDDDMQCSSLGNSRTSWGAASFDYILAKERDTEYSLGQFVWTGIDYIGEPTPYHTKNSYFGLLDTALFPKDAYYTFKSCWNEKAEPFVHLYPYWDFNIGQKIDIIIASNTSSVELFKDGVSLGKRDFDKKKDSFFCAHFVTEYSPGTLKAVGYDVFGKAVAEAFQTGFGDVKSLELSETEFDIEKGDTKLRFITIQGIDSDGNYVKNANCRVNLNVNGPAALAGLDNGDSTDNDSYKGNSKRLFSGKLLAIIKPAGEAGRVKINATIDKTDIPVRKLQINAPDGCCFTKEQDTLEFKTEVFPPDAKDFDIEYQITNASGTIVNCALIESISNDQRTVRVKAQCDAEFKLRALCHEKDNRVSIISCLELSASGIGNLMNDPYRFVYASLYDKCDGDVGNGNEKGISTSRENDSWVLYRNIDFGNRGSDTLTLPVFELDSARTVISIWDGEPKKEGSELLLDGIYDKKSIWNVYQEETFKLAKRLKGVHDIAFMTHSHKIHLKGFVFKEFDPSYEINNASDADNIYGDSFVNADGAVTGIGNNVTLGFSGFNLSQGAGKILICGKTPLDGNTIHIIFAKDGISERRIVEFKGCREYTERCFELEGISGRYDIEFLFLPGSNFDFKYFRFIKSNTETEI